MPSWPTKPLGDVCELINGRAFKPADWGKEGLRIVRIQNLNDPTKPFNCFAGEYRDAHFIDDGAILLSWSGTPGTSFGCFRWGRGPALLNQHIFRVVVDEQLIDGEFFIHAVNSRLDEMIGQAHGGVGLRHITKSKLEAIHVPLPPLDEQRRIVGRIKECLKRVEEIEGLRESQRAQITPIQDSVIDALLDDAWCTRRLVEVTTDIRNGWSGGQHADAPEMGMLRLSCVHSKHVDTTKVKTVRVTPDVVRDFALKTNDVLVVRGNGSSHLVGRTAIVEKDSEVVIFSDLLIRLRFTSDILPAFANLVFHSRQVREQIRTAAKTAAGIWKINQTGLQNLSLPCPPLECQATFVDAATSALAYCAQFCGSICDSEVPHLRESILRKAFAGEM